jgi:2-keto-4-pentenoate hydratase/2-oxohepta-3-ene-1,7-dioic acid hydratase in catechol pathway
MGLLVVRYKDNEGARWGVLDGAAPLDGDASISVRPLAVATVTTGELIAAFDAGLPEPGAAREVPARALLSPVTHDATLICQGLNYADHAAEAQHHARKQNLFFAKASSTLSGAYDAIERPPEVELLDYEVEFGIVLRQKLTQGAAVDASSLGQYVAGVVLCNDVSARDIMFGASFLQWFQGKSYRGFCPAGPVLYLLAPDEVAGVLENLELKLCVNGELRQSTTSERLIFKPAETLAQLSKILDLKAGDLVLTGTPAGVTAPATPKLVEILKTNLLADDVRRQELRVEMSKARPFLQPGDVVTATLRDGSRGISLGGLSNQIRAA